MSIHFDRVFFLEGLSLKQKITVKNKVHFELIALFYSIWRWDMLINLLIDNQPNVFVPSFTQIQM